MKYIYILLTALILIMVKINITKPVGRCSGDEYCTSCSNCKYCGHCSSGGKCGVCAPAGYYKKKPMQKENKEETHEIHKRTIKTSESPTITSSINDEVDSNLIRALSNQKRQYDSINQINGKKSTLFIDTKEEEVFTVVEEMPEFPGGAMQMMKWIQKNLQYPKSAKEKGITGKCFVKFIVNSDGQTSDVIIIKGVSGCEECDSEAIRLVEAMPKWKPAKQNGVSVPVYFNLPINFNLQ